MNRKNPQKGRYYRSAKRSDHIYKIKLVEARNSHCVVDILNVASGEISSGQVPFANVGEEISQEELDKEKLKALAMKIGRIKVRFESF